MTEEVLEQQPSFNLGQQLSKAREQHKISIVEMAQKLKLTASQIEALEREDYSQLGPVTFVKGYIRSYCREFTLNETELMSQFSHQREEAEKRMQSFSRRTEREAKDNRLMLFSYAIIALIIGSSLFIWWQNRDTSSTIDTPVVEQPINSDVANITSQDTEQTPQVTAAENIALQDESEAVNDANTSVNNSVLTQAELTPSNQAIVNEPETAQRISSADTIIMTFKDDSWVEIFDAEGERVAFGVKKKGYVMTLEGKAPFNVVLGKHYIVDVEFNGQLVDISHFPTNRLAKFSLPLSE
ncbi:RodZ domain-containing protein [Pseudoalteromonas piratica]|uniref:Cytoskeleton protein RodZ-like C-terminal domain-containing protein n=1 Tax=Pseudoalteromonas piratica TaxID=1348114 RepID=A0A0A7EFI7_9GAMM|nr:RodZ domain-containing protein [Pseudoalteromonas piratica]AIY64821.1 hypothetical protein OM33_06415 [Pseudoalteromonas piratica]